MNLMGLIAALSGALAVVLGAFGAHGLKKFLAPEQLTVWHTGVEYQFYHTLALLALVLLQGNSPSPWLPRAGGCFIAGMVMFSGSLYLLSCRNILGLGGFASVLGPITPLGGLCFIAGWICLAMAFLKK